jgi:galacturan 1,4-alpha-galacturonidase
VQISEVHYIDVTGTASGKVANSTVATLECSAECYNITATGTDLMPKNGTAKYLCANLANESLLDFPCTDVPVSKG